VNESLLILDSAHGILFNCHQSWSLPPLPLSILLAHSHIHLPYDNIETSTNMDGCTPYQRLDSISLTSISSSEGTKNDNQNQSSKATDMTSSLTSTHKEEEDGDVDDPIPSDPSLLSRSLTDNKSSGWERCPVEIRDMILDELEYEYPNYFDWEGFIPPLIAALRPLSLSYQQALQRFMDKSRSCLRMNPSTGFDIGGMNQMELDTFQSANLELR